MTPQHADARTRTDGRTDASEATAPLTLDVLRRKLDAAIVAEAWDAVKTIRERMVEVERHDAGTQSRPQSDAEQEVDGTHRG